MVNINEIVKGAKLGSHLGGTMGKAAEEASPIGKLLTRIKDSALHVKPEEFAKALSNGERADLNSFRSAFMTAFRADHPNATLAESGLAFKRLINDNTTAKEAEMFFASMEEAQHAHAAAGAGPAKPKPSQPHNAGSRDITPVKTATHKTEEPHIIDAEWEEVPREEPAAAHGGGHGGGNEPPKDPPRGSTGGDEPPRDPPQQNPGFIGGNRQPSPATMEALKDHEKFRGFAFDRLTAFSTANKLFEAGSSQDLVQKFSKLDDMVGAFNIKDLGAPGKARVDALGNLENPEVLFSSMTPKKKLDAAGNVIGDIEPKGEPIGLAPTSKADPTSVNGKILSYYDNEGTPIKPLIAADRASPDDVNKVLQQLLSYKPGTEVHIHPADWEKVRGAVYERRFNELSGKLSGGQRLDATPGTSAVGKDSARSELDDYIEAARITGRVKPDATHATGRSISDIVAGSRGPNGRISEEDIDAIRRSHTAARAAENNPTSNLVRDIVDTLKPTTKEVADVQTEMGNLRRNVRASGMLDTTPLDPNVPPRTIDEISDALRNGEQVKSPELERYISKQIGDSLESSQRSLVAALQSGFNANKRLDTEQIFTQLERIRKDPDYPLRDARLDAKTTTASPKDINERLFSNRPISDRELTVLRSFYKRFFDAASAPADSGGTGIGIKALQIAQSITDGIKDAKSVPAASISRATQYNTGVVIPSVRKTIISSAVPVAFAGALGQAYLDPEHPNFIGRASIDFVVPDGNKNASDFAEFIYGRMNANTAMARKEFNDYLGLTLPTDAAKGQTKTDEQLVADKNFYNDAIQRMRNGSFIKEPTGDLRQAMMMYATVKATGVVSASNAEAQTQLNQNVEAEAGALTADANKANAGREKAKADALISGAPDAGVISGAFGNAVNPGTSSDTSSAIAVSPRNGAQIKSNLDALKTDPDFGITDNEYSQLSKAWASATKTAVVPNLEMTVANEATPQEMQDFANQAQQILASRLSEQAAKNVVQNYVIR